MICFDSEVTFWGFGVPHKSPQTKPRGMQGVTSLLGRSYQLETKRCLMGLMTGLERLESWQGAINVSLDASAAKRGVQQIRPFASMLIRPFFWLNGEDPILAV